MRQKAKVLFWDEISMMHKHGLEAVNRTLQDLRGNNVMGGLILFLAGDFQQTLPVIPRGTMADEIKACLKSSYLWKQVEIMKLTTNMRIQSNCQNSQRFSDYLLKILRQARGNYGKWKNQAFQLILQDLSNIRKSN
ncbi:hypothetical protein AVEN_45892-1 [Araneus ventricosus]|uniref:ATP-dependent DNA helicase n=1 Tax=Araneus ventricosus TaxID=182803 RepID=A0A4Y2JZS6_ARAVE|nr:hypothetical protein AVEN_45892-1 [Araneus ventricosus]